MITQERLKELFDYNQETGEFTRLVTVANRAKAGSIAGCKAGNYLQIRIDYKLYYAHQLAWLYVYGYLPKQIDHINHNGCDNRLENLRETDYVANNRNHPMRKTNTSGATGVTWNKRAKKWFAQIHMNGKCKGLGYYNDIKDAITARKDAEMKYGFHANHGMEVA